MSTSRPHTDVHAPRFRVRPPANWINDPNGPFRWRGRYHLFYQHNPDAPVHANMHWGHVSSADLAHWEHHPIALTPTPGGPDEEAAGRAVWWTTRASPPPSTPAWITNTPGSAPSAWPKRPRTHRS